VKVAIALISIFVGIPLFILNARWIASESVAELNQLSRSQLGIGPGWNSYIIEHGKVIEWKLGTVEENPFLFGVSAIGNLLLLTPFLMIFLRWKMNRVNE
jgi:hypothetical protein